MQITEQIILTFITACLAPVLLAAIGIVAVWSKNRAVATKERVEAENEQLKADAAKVTAEAERVKTEALERLERVRGDTTQIQSVMQMFQQQITINKQYRQLLAQSRQTAESNYRVLANTQRDVGQMLLTEIQHQSKELGGKIDNLPSLILVSNTQSLTEATRAIAAEIGVVMVERFELFRAESSFFPFPDPDDSEWREDTVYALNDDVVIRKEARFWDNARLQKPCAKISTLGQKARVITGRLKGWVIVDLTVDGNHCWGFLKESDVRIGEPEATPA